MAKYDKNTKFYWLQVKEDFFEEEPIEWLEEQENGIVYSHFYLKLCLKSLRSNGVLIRKVGDILIPYDTKKLSEITKTDRDTVIVAMQLLQRIGLIKVLESGEIYLTQVENMIGAKSIGAFKKQQQRLLQSENQTKNLTENLEGGQMSPKCPIEQELELELELEQQQEIRDTFSEKDIASIKKFIKENNVAVDVVMEKLKLINSKQNITNKVGALFVAIKDNWQPNKSDIDPSTFNNFESREYDYKSLENKLLGWDK